MIVSIQLLSGCRQPEAAGQSVSVTNTAEVSNSNSQEKKIAKDSNKNNFEESQKIQETAEVENKKDSQQHSFTGLINLEQKLKKENLDHEERLNIKKLLKWGDGCDVDYDEYFVNEKKALMSFYDLGNKEYLIEVICQGGAYNFGYLFYHYSERDFSPTAKLIQFKWYNGWADSKKTAQNVSYNPKGSAEFLSREKRLKIFFKSAGHSGCGYENTFAFSNGKAILTETKANWNCANSVAPDNWKKQNLKKLKGSVVETQKDSSN